MADDDFTAAVAAAADRLVVALAVRGWKPPFMARAGDYVRPDTGEVDLIALGQADRNADTANRLTVLAALREVTGGWAL